LGKLSNTFYKFKYMYLPYKPAIQNPEEIKPTPIKTLE
jgi:hypothetical protein